MEHRDPDTALPAVRDAAASPARGGIWDLVSRRARLRGTVYLLLDRSTSMFHDGKILQLKAGALRFFAEAWHRDYAVGAVAFGSRAELLLGASRNAHRFSRRLLDLAPGGRTAMAAAIRMAVWRLRWRGGDRVIVLITDGMPDSREATLRAAALARARGITLIAIGTDHADEAFLAALTPRPELASRVERGALAGAIGRAAEALPGT